MKTILILITIMAQIAFAGGVDVGNALVNPVPGTNALINSPKTWLSSTAANVLTIKNQSGSIIEAKKSEITDLASPNAEGLQQYLNEKFPGRNYKIISLNGLDGVRADLSSSALATSSDLYLVSELKDFIHIQTNLKKADNGIVEGNNIIQSVRVKYHGVPYPNSIVKTVILTYGVNKDTGWPFAYSFADDCYLYTKEETKRKLSFNLSLNLYA